MEGERKEKREKKEPRESEKKERKEEHRPRSSTRPSSSRHGSDSKDDSRERSRRSTSRSSSGPKKDERESKEKREHRHRHEHKHRSSSSRQKSEHKSSSTAPAPSATALVLKEEPMPDLGPLMKVEPHRGVISMLEQHAKNFGDQQAFVWCDDKGKDTPMTYLDLWRKTKMIIYILLKKFNLSKARCGDRVVLLFEPGIQFISVCLGCFGAGVVAVPMYPPMNVQRDVPKIMRVIENCSPKAILVSSEVKLFLTTSKIKAKFTATKGQILELPSDLVYEVPKKDSSNMELPVPYDPSALALLQYTSGSTGDPKGVMLTNHNVTHNVCCVAAAYGLSEKDRIASWQPMYHDMGLMGLTLLPIRQRIFAVFMSPVTFITNPPFYIEKCAQYKINLISGATFAYGLLARKWPPNKKVDLSLIKHAAIAAERIVPAIMDQFEKVFCPMGFKKDCWVPMYGLAENTVLVTSNPNKSVYKVFGDRASCGVPQFDIVVKIVNPHTCEEMPSEEEGEIWVDGPSKGQGYWGAPDRSEATFRAVLKGDTKRTYLRTGDLGRMHGRELTVSGRIKEIIIIRGKKYHPEDIEGSAFEGDTNGLLRPGGTVACPWEAGSGEEELAIVSEARDEKTPFAQLEQVAKAAMAAVTQNCSIHVSRFVIVPPRALPKTSRRDDVYLLTTIYIHCCSVPQASPEAQKFCDGVALAMPIWAVPYDEARRRYAAVITPTLPKLSVFSAASVFAEGRHGQIPLRLYRPDGSLGKSLPVTFFFHGGGWVFGSLDTHDHFCRDLCRRAGTAVVAAPEHKFPVPIEDAEDAVEWVFKFSQRLTLNTEKMILCGESAGANVALAVALTLRDKKNFTGPCINALVLLYPPLDAYMGSWSFQNYPDYGLSRESAMYFRDAYIKLDQASNPLISTVYAKLRGLPRIRFLSAECDPLIDEGMWFVQKLKEAEVDVTHKIYPAQIHGFATLPMQFATAVNEAMTDVSDAIKAFNGPPTSARG